MKKPACKKISIDWTSDSSDVYVYVLDVFVESQAALPNVGICQFLYVSAERSNNDAKMEGKTHQD